VARSVQCFVIFNCRNLYPNASVNKPRRFAQHACHGPNACTNVLCSLSDTAVYKKYLEPSPSLSQFQKCCTSVMQQQRPRKTRAILTEQQAVEIFRFKSASAIPQIKLSALFVARRYGIHEKTVRDIWKQRTWSHATRSLDGSAGSMETKRIGRPVGSKNKKPRNRKLAEYASSSSFSPSPPNALECDNWPQPSLRSKCNQNLSCQQDSETTIPMIFGSPHLESPEESDILVDRSPYVDEQKEEASIDDQLHSWAHGGSQWITIASLHIDAEFSSAQ
jgi:hypothetical protein